MTNPTDILNGKAVKNMTFIKQEIIEGGFKFTMLSNNCKAIIHDDADSSFRKFWLNENCLNFKHPDKKYIGSLKICDVMVYDAISNKLFLIENKSSQYGNKSDGTAWDEKDFHNEIMPKYVGTINSLIYAKLFYRNNTKPFNFYNDIVNCKEITMILNFDIIGTSKIRPNLWVKFNEFYNKNNYNNFFKNNFKFFASSPSRINELNLPFKIERA